MGHHVPSVNRPLEWDIHGSVNWTTVCGVLRVTWCNRVRFSCYFRQKRGTINVCKSKVLRRHLVQRIRLGSVKCEILAAKFTYKFTLGSQIHEIVKFVLKLYEFRTNLPQFPLFRFLTALKACFCLFL